jgi:hypothetical protein
LIEIGLLVLEKNISFLNFSKFLFFSYNLLGNGVVLRLYNSESPLPKNDFANYGKIWPSGSGEEVVNVKV